MAVTGRVLSDAAVREGLRRLAPLPAWLVAGADAAIVGAELVAGVPELAADDWVLERCEPRLRAKAGSGWTASYRLTLVDSAGAPRIVALSGEYAPATAMMEATRTRGSIGTPTWEVEVPRLGLSLRTRSEDKGLPALDDLTDPERARALLEESLQDPWPGIRIASCQPEVMRYKPGSRCTVRYRLGYEPGREGPSVVVAKTYRGEKGANAFRGMSALDRAGIPASTVALAPALAYLPELKVLVQGAVSEEATLKQLAHRAGESGAPDAFAALAPEVAKAATGLAALHKSGVTHGDLVTWDEEAADVADVARRVAELAPETAGAVDDYLGALRQLAVEHPADQVGPAHRSFRPAQVLLAGGGISFIDFDGLCTAEPAIDVALFRAALRDATLHLAPDDAEALRQRLEAMGDICDQFLRAYEAVAPISRARVALWEGLYLLTFVLHCWTKVRPRRITGRMMLLTSHLEAMEREFSGASGSG
jgi:hypothetical protein